ncbi:hypothetical protein [Aurantiacibacter luteus]|uniref:Uncharacterized protein n=1 Tax=Aurantiacibacter luteus TaxID=1581420 RepID=A0A0G9MTS3_9SPHN|nr:hypothetical protein [Aurantiacibacter luteus]KLE34125.1 hypothetical protein AAW00_07535 [Aurantiacibacter luteus]
MTDDDRSAERGHGERRKGERRQAQMPFEGPDRRQTGDRRSGTDRRANPRLQVRRGEDDA